MVTLPLWTFSTESPTLNWPPTVSFGDFPFLLNLYLGGNSYHCFRLLYNGSELRINKTSQFFIRARRSSGALAILGEWFRSTTKNWRLQLVNLEPLNPSRSPNDPVEPLSTIFIEPDATVLRPDDWDSGPVFMFDELSGRLAFCTSFQDIIGVILELIDFT